MPSHSEGPGIWLSVWRFLVTHCLYERAAKVLARLRRLAWTFTARIGDKYQIRFARSIWAMSRENLFMPYANNKGADQPAHLHSLISALVVRCLDSIIPLLAIAEISRLASLYSWAGWFESYLVANPEDRFSRDGAHIFAEKRMKMISKNMNME